MSEPGGDSATSATAILAAGAAATATPRDPRDPREAPARYRLIERLDEGAMGVVWIAEDTALHRKVAFKVLHDRLLGGDFQEQLAREARTMARLNHPNVVAVYDVGVHDGRTFVAMELVVGRSLGHWLDTPRRWDEVVAVFRDVAAGLVAAHDAGVVHRDVKPGNILVGDDGRARIADFGVAHAGRARAPDGAATDTTQGTIGSPAYMSPE
ncbi:MAG: serine/threonine protein kinase, partial [Myxococcales bacterium]|nr:serine/threonine protein kinase [Myxococcales bacterium]